MENDSEPKYPPEFLRKEEEETIEEKTELPGKTENNDLLPKSWIIGMSLGIAATGALFGGGIGFEIYEEGYSSPTLLGGQGNKTGYLIRGDKEGIDYRFFEYLDGKSELVLNYCPNYSKDQITLTDLDGDQTIDLIKNSTGEFSKFETYLRAGNNKFLKVPSNQSQERFDKATKVYENWKGKLASEIADGHNLWKFWHGETFEESKKDGLDKFLE